MEVVAHLAADRVEFDFQGGTALHARLATRARLSIDDDLRAKDPIAVHVGLRRFVERFPNSGIHLQDPPRELKIQGVKHVLTFTRTQDPDRVAPLRILVEVVQPTGAEHNEWG